MAPTAQAYSPNQYPKLKRDINGLGGNGTYEQGGHANDAELRFQVGDEVEVNVGESVRVVTPKSASEWKQPIRFMSRALV